MFVLTLGMQASASTWVFNVVRRILAIHHPSARSLFEESGEIALQRLASAEHAVIKAHRVDQEMLNLVRLTDGKIIISIRDPRDVLTSMRERFSIEYRSTFVSVSETLACINSIPLDIPLLNLEYESGFFRNIESIGRIASFIGAPISEDQSRDIFDALRPESVDLFIKKSFERNGGVDRIGNWDDATQWHPGHVGDGLSGKWEERLEPLYRMLGTEVLLPLQFSRNFEKVSLFWPAQCFYSKHGEVSESFTDVEVTNSGDALIWGPSLYLPVGRWRFRPLIYNPGRNPITVKLDIFVADGERQTVASRTSTFPTAYSVERSLDLDVLSWSERIDFRVLSVSRVQVGAFRFSGVKLDYLGPCDERHALRTSSVSE